MNKPLSSSEVLGFGGLWDTTWGKMRLAVNDDKVEGLYHYSSGSSISGELVDDKLQFRYKEPDAEGEGWFKIKQDGRSFSGQYRAAGEKEWQPWNGERLCEDESEWLVIFEAHWEASLAEREYAFGEMLRNYFKMADAKHVKVRHRFFHDSDDLVRFCGEVALLPGSVVLLIATHGDDKGITVDGKTIGGKEIALGLRDASNVKLLHLSGCLMMKGELPDRIFSHLQNPRFPITGYSREVGWDSSAIADFTFLSMILIHGMDPKTAVEETHRVAPFTGNKVQRGSVFQAQGLEIKQPPSPAE